MMSSKSILKVFSAISIMVGATLAFGASERGYLGVGTAEVGPELARHLQLGEGTGLTVTVIDPEGPVADTLKVGDVLLRINDQILVDPRQLTILVRSFKPGESVGLTFIRSGTEQQAEVELGAASERVAPRRAPQQQRLQPHQPPALGQRMAPRSSWFEDMQAELEERMGAFQSNFGALDEMLQNLQQYMGVPGQGGSVHSSSSSSVNITRIENGVRMTYTRNNGDERMVVVDADGDTVFDGPVGTDSDLESLPPEALRFLQSINVQIDFEPEEEAELIPSDAI